MNGIAAPIVAYEPSPTQDFLKPRRKVSVVMVVYMTGEALEQSLHCVLADPLVDELVVVDNGSTRMEAARLKGYVQAVENLADRYRRNGYTASERLAIEQRYASVERHLRNESRDYGYGYGERR